MKITKAEELKIGDTFRIHEYELREHKNDIWHIINDKQLLAIRTLIYNHYPQVKFDVLTKGEVDLILLAR